MEQKMVPEQVDDVSPILGGCYWSGKEWHRASIPTVSPDVRIIIYDVQTYADKYSRDGDIGVRYKAGTVYHRVGGGYHDE